MKTFKLILVLAFLASLLAIPCTTSFARDTVSSSNPAAVQVVRKEEVKKERGFFEKILDAVKSVVIFFTADKPAPQEQRKVVEQPTVQPAQQALVIPEIELEAAEVPEKAAEPADTTVRQTQTVKTDPPVSQESLSKADVPQVQLQQRQFPPPASTSPDPTLATPTPTPVITVTQGPPVDMPQPVERKDLLGLSKIEVAEEKADMPELVVIPKVAEDVREPEMKSEPAEIPKTAAAVQAPVIVRSPPVRMPSGQVTTTTTSAGARTTETTTATAATTGARTTATTEPITPTRVTPTQTIEALPEAIRETPPATEPVPRTTRSYTERFDGQIISMTAADSFAVVDTADNRTFVVSLSGEGKVECPSGGETAARETATRETTTREPAARETAATEQRTAAEVTRPLSAPPSAPSRGTLTQQAAAVPQTLTAAGSVAGTAAAVQQTVPDTVKAEMLALCPPATRLVTTEEPAPASDEARFLTIAGGRTTYVRDNVIQSIQIMGSETGTEPEEEAEETAVKEGPPKISTIYEVNGCQATLMIDMLCGDKICTGEYDINASGPATKTEPSTFVFTPNAQPMEEVNIALNKKVPTAGTPDLTITITAKKEGEEALEEKFDLLQNEEIAKCMNAKKSSSIAGGGAPDFLSKDALPIDVVSGPLSSGDGADISGGGCALIRQ